MTEQGARRPEGIEMQHMDLWFDLAIRGETNLEEEALARFQLTDGAEPDRRPDHRSKARSAAVTRAASDPSAVAGETTNGSTCFAHGRQINRSAPKSTIDGAPTAAARWLIPESLPR